MISPGEQVPLSGARESGVLLHITSLPAGEGIGDLGAAAHQFVEWLAAAGQRWWQVLPCGEVGFGESPYQSISAYAGNSLLLSLRALVADGLLSEQDVGDLGSHADSSSVDFPSVQRHKTRLLDLACENFLRSAGAWLRTEFERFEKDPAQHWLQDYARFVVLKARFGAIAWTAWPKEFVERNADALARLDVAEAQALAKVRLQQFFFHKQWQALRTHARRMGIRLFGDCPIYVAADSVDVWCAPELFDLNADGSPRVVAGVPPDYFSATGQLWGNPLYRWEVMATDGFAWWRDRLQHCATLFDLTRIDHFRGLQAYWEVPANAPDASSGTWQAGPGAAMLTALTDSPSGSSSRLPLVAEDLGEITDEVHELRAQFNLPGMRVLQFGFDGGDDNPHALENIGADVVVYAGTHDNNTTPGWLDELDEQALARVLEQLGCDSKTAAASRLVDLALASAAPLAILTLPDLLLLGAEARLNTPGSVGDNWHWRVRSSELSHELAQSLAQRSEAAGRLAPIGLSQVTDLATSTPTLSTTNPLGSVPSLAPDSQALRG